MSRFYPRGPRGAATFMASAWARRITSFYPRGPRGAATRHYPGTGQDAGVSIRAARAGPRPDRARRLNSAEGVSIRAARAGPRQAMSTATAISSRFLSARPARGRDRLGIHVVALEVVSIRAARAGPRRARLPRSRNYRPGFYPRGPRGAATPGATALRRQPRVSIRAARAGPRRPVVAAVPGTTGVSIRAARAGPRRISPTTSRPRPSFYPRGPRGAATRCRTHAYRH